MEGFLVLCSPVGDVLSIEGTAATVRVTLEDWHGIAFTDFHSLLKIDGEWKIIAKIFHQY